MSELVYQYIEIHLMYNEQSQGSYCELIDKPISFFELNETCETTKESGSWFKIEFVKMTERQYKNLPEFTGF